jgi:hypothetical protein
MTSPRQKLELPRTHPLIPTRTNRQKRRVRIARNLFRFRRLAGLAYNAVSAPSWFFHGLRSLISSSAELFICDSCDEKGLAFTDKHTKRHAIVRCKRAAEDVSTEERLISLEARLGKMERTLNNVLGKLEREDILRVSDVVEEVAAETTTS